MPWLWVFLVLFPFAHIVGLCFFGGLYCWVDVGCLPRAVGFMLGCFVGFARTWVLLFDGICGCCARMWVFYQVYFCIGLLPFSSDLGEVLSVFRFFWVFLS